MTGRRYTKIDDAEEAEILRLLKLGLPAAEVGRITQRSIGVVTRVRDEHGIEPQGRWGAPPSITEEPAESEGCGLASPWIPPDGWDPTADRPCQRQWLAMLAAASGMELVSLRHAVCRVLGLPAGATDHQLDAAVIADRRLAEQLAERYLMARASLR